MPGPRPVRTREELSSPGRPQVTVLAGPTAVGKGTVSQFIREHFPQVWLSVSATTRAARPGEEDGRHYFFVSPERFDELVEQDQMLEWAVVHGVNRYGTRRDTVQQALDQGQRVLLEIDLQGARQVRESLPEATFVFLAPPSWDELVHRLVGRGTESPEEQRRRLETARMELAAEPEFDAVVVNDTVERAAEELVRIMGLDPAERR
ncbi:guanylate kinase [Micrococcus terreus]|uniref:guanylate kinase n=1 Tax=Micrococcus terreus TaxID=574650 RepID=UPI000B89D194|nr:guanylate kinase [Micrococcus terreus]MDK7700270.1 guanylate kinase [Micrococcus terreus]WOO98915.1 guanylate kinase [Micrococcus terreus]